MRTETKSEVKKHSIKLSKQKIQGPFLWALDPFNTEDVLIEKIKTLISSFRIQLTDFLPVALFSPYDLGWIMKMGPKIKLRALANVKSTLKKKWQPLGIEDRKVGLYVTESNSLRDKIQLLLQTATKKKAKMIIVGSGAKSRSKLTGLGSFSEALLSLSPIPILVLGEAAEVTAPEKILFATDFSEVSKKAYKKVLAIAREQGSEILIYHYLNLEAGPIAYGVTWGYETHWLEDFWKVQAELMEAKGLEWKAWTIKQGLPCMFALDKNSGNLSNRILDVATQQKVNMIALGVKRGPWSQVILGRNVREIFANSTCPVLAVHAKAEKEKFHS